MSDSSGWLERYEASHSDLRFPAIYWAAVPLVVLGTVGILWSIPVPAEFFEISPLLNWGSAFLMAAAVYYFIISLSLAIGMLPFLVGLASVQMWLADSEYPAIYVSTGILLAGIIGLAIGLKSEGRFLAIARDLQLMMIGPAWLLSAVYRRLGIPI